MKDIISDNSEGLYVTDFKKMAHEYAEDRSRGKGGTILEFDDEDIGHLLKGHNRDHEAFIPYDKFDQVSPESIKVSK
jgi:hypothetical protein